MTQINVKALESLVGHLKTTTEAALNPNISPVITQMRDETKAIAEKLAEANRELGMQRLGIMDESFALEGASQESDTLGLKFNKSNKQQSQNAAINWLLETSTTVVKVLNQHSVILGSLLEQHEKDVVKIKKDIKKWRTKLLLSTPKLPPWRRRMTR